MTETYASGGFVTYGDDLFAITQDGTLYALNPAAASVKQSIFLGGTDHIATGVAAPPASPSPRSTTTSGTLPTRASTPGTTSTATTDPGDTIGTTYDKSRTANIGYPAAGGDSFYFGLEYPGTAFKDSQGHDLQTGARTTKTPTRPSTTPTTCRAGLTDR